MLTPAPAILLALLAPLITPDQQTGEPPAVDLQISAPRVLLVDVPWRVTLAAPGARDDVEVAIRGPDDASLARATVPFGQEVSVEIHGITGADELPLRVFVGGLETERIDVPLLPGWLSLLPPLLAILLALAFREVLTSLFAGVWLGCLFLADFDPLAALLMAVDEFARGELTDSGHASIIMFTLMLGGMVGVTSKMGGTRALVDTVTPLATTPRRGQLASWLAGLVIFFDDYSNSLIVGNTMRPLTDRLRISREKLAYIVDSTAAPVAAVFFISTWIGYEVGLIGDGLTMAAQQQSHDASLVADLQSASPFAVFIETIPHLFYPLFAIFLVACLAITRRDFGPMLRAERRARRGEGVYRKGAQLAADMDSDLAEVQGAPRRRWWNGALPVTVLVGTVLVGLIHTGRAALEPGQAATLRNIFGHADPYMPLMWGATLSGLTALILAAGQRILSLRQAVAAWLAGTRAMLLAIMILVLAWSLGKVTGALGTASYLSGPLSSTLPEELLPACVFVVSSLIAFATGTSWATMAILLPIVVPLAIGMAGGVSGLAGSDHAVVFGSIGSVLAGAIMGDHCSPISDTTVLSSTASCCDHVDHVRTQLPYALTVAAVAVLCGSLPTGFGLPAGVSLIIGATVLFLFVRLVGRRVDLDGDRPPE